MRSLSIWACKSTHYCNTWWFIRALCTNQLMNSYSCMHGLPLSTVKAASFEYCKSMTSSLLQALLNPFHMPNAPITSSNFQKKAQVVAKKYLHS